MIWLIGNKGMLGSDVELILKDSGVDYFSSDMEVDICNYSQLEAFAKGKKIKWIINCSAYTAVDKAEEEREKAFDINSQGVMNIAGIAKHIKAKLIHISTDYVFDGVKEGPYFETDITNPLSIYGQSKLEGEKNIQNTIANYFIIRISWLYGQGGSNFVHTMVRLFKEKEELKVIDDQWGSPTFTKDVAKVILKIIKDDSENYGIYNFTNEGKTSWHLFAKEIYRLSRQYGIVQKDVNILPIKTENYIVKTSRPKNSYLSKEKIEKELNVNLKKWEDSLDDYLKNFNK
ncbi:dTDP-4-dehydrorhamnose reductase [Spirochaetota bacterium]